MIDVKECLSCGELNLGVSKGEKGCPHCESKNLGPAYCGDCGGEIVFDGVGPNECAAFCKRCKKKYT